MVPPGDHEAFLAALRDLLTDEESRAEMGRAGRRYAEQAFDIEAIADRFELVLVDAAD